MRRSGDGDGDSEESWRRVTRDRKRERERGKEETREGYRGGCVRGIQRKLSENFLYIENSSASPTLSVHVDSAFIHPWRTASSATWTMRADAPSAYRRNFVDSDDEESDPDWPPPSHAIHYDGDSPDVEMAYCLSRYLVELLSVRPRFPFAGTFSAFNCGSSYYFSSPKGQQQCNVDSQGNLLLRAQGKALEEGFQIRIEIPDGDNGIDDGNLIFRVNPYQCNQVITCTIPTGSGRKIDVAFVPLYCAIQARVFVNLDFMAGAAGSSKGGAICYVYGEITAHHQFYGDKNVMLFYSEEGNKVEVVGGKLPLLRSWAAVPIYLDPLLIIKLSLHVSTNPEHDPDGHTISFQGDLTFDRDQYEKSICNAHHGVVKVQISYE
ncbi:hypothetical protein ZWY2020_053413 [Hordeum vulgare]|nr:hypothetical protein ZWY2020_053413 [Hordeum vulgare]